MKAYAILAGGGVKGAALAGCLRAAEEQGVLFAGYGGTSAGSMVALLAAAGYSGKELGELLVDLDFRTLLEDGGAALERTKALVAGAARAAHGGWWAKLRALLDGARAVRSLGPELGLYAGQPLKQYLLGKIQERLPQLAGHADVTFEHLHAAGCLPLKVVASDVTLRRPALFSRTETTYGSSVLDAVRASTSYPFAFQPVRKNGRCLVDGGLASNLPVFLFEPEYRETRVPALAFDLVSAPASLPANYDLGRHAADLLATALEAGDELLRRVLRGVVHIPIATPAGIDTLDFGLSRDDRKRLLDAGYQAVASFLNGYAPLQRVKTAAEEMKRRLQAEHGPPQLYAPVLYGLARQIEEETGASDVRVQVMLPTGRPEGTLLVVYGHRMEAAADSDLELPEGAGCPGRAWTLRAPAIADLEQARRSPEHWGMSPEQLAKIPEGLASMLCVPVHGEMPQTGQEPPAPVGTLAVDSPTPLRATGWLERAGPKVTASSRVVGIMRSWAYVLYHLLRR
jgi:NTE family protein